MSKVNHQSQVDPEVKVEQTLGSAEQFLQKNKNTLFVVLVALLVVVGGYLAYRNLYKEPLKTEAMEQLFMAEQYFRVDSFATALHGDGNAYGFLQIQQEYGSNAGKSLPYYIGVCHLQLGEYEEAIAALKQYKGDDEITPAGALCCIGDAYVELNDLDKAYDYFMQAANLRDNDYTARYLMKAALVCEEQGKTADALKLYERVKTDYSSTAEGSEVDKYITRLDPTL